MTIFEGMAATPAGAAEFTDDLVVTGDLFLQTVAG